MFIVETFEGAHFRTLTIADPDQDRQLMTAVALPATQPPLLSFASSLAPEQQGDVLTTVRRLFSRAPRPRPARRASSSDQKGPSSFAPDDHDRCRLPSPPPHGRSVRDLQIPIGRALPNRASSSPRFPPYEVFVRRPRAQPARPQRAGVRNPSVKPT